MPSLPYAEDFADEVREQLLAVDGVLVWVDPIHGGKTRTELEAMLRDVAAHGPWVSAHPDVILKMGVKDADSGGSRPRFRDDLAHHSDLMSLGVPR